MHKNSLGWFQYSGAIHMHTTDSDGAKPIEEVIRIGQSAGLEFMMFTDHMTLNQRDLGKEGIYGKTLVVIGYEHNDLNDENHYLLFGTPQVYPENATAAEYVSAGDKDGALGIMAHPDEIRDTLPEHPPYAWTDWSVKGYDGMELWNQMSEWLEKLNRFNKLIMAFSPRKSMVGPTDRILKTWDQVNLRRKVVGVAGVDAHAFPIKVWPMTVEIFPYKVHFRSLRCHILLPDKISGDFEVARAQLYDAFRDCRLFFSNLRWGNADKFEFYARNENEQAHCGGNIDSIDGTRLFAKLPSRAKIKLIYNGECLVESVTDNLEFKVTTPGIYRLEAWKGKRGWIFTNHIRIGQWAV